VGRTLNELALHALQVEVLQWRAENGATTHEIDEQRPLEGSDTLVLFGRPSPLELAQDKLLKG
jgi:CPA2 family monovalent cation:H+ antiporter-2